MRMQPGNDLVSAMRKNATMRNMVNSLFDEQKPEWAQKLEGYETRYQFAVDGRWIQYEIEDETTGEMIIYIDTVDTPEEL